MNNICLQDWWSLASNYELTIRIMTGIHTNSKRGSFCLMVKQVRAVGSHKIGKGNGYQQNIGRLNVLGDTHSKNYIYMYMYQSLPLLCLPVMWWNRNSLWWYQHYCHQLTQYRKVVVQQNRMYTAVDSTGQIDIIISYVHKDLHSLALSLSRLLPILYLGDYM